MKVMRPPAIQVTNLCKFYGKHEAVSKVDLFIEEGEVLAFLGPNGAGKTTTIEILEGFRPRTAGEVSVLGEDPATAGLKWRERIGIVMQESQPEEYLTTIETLTMWSSYFTTPRPANEVLELVGLADNRKQRVKHLSTGQRRRLDLALALIGDPELLFLDEPTTGFDPTARREAWAMLDGLRSLGVTVLLTTHYMDEAHNLADRISVIAAGRIIATGTVKELTEVACLQTHVSWCASEVPLDDLPERLRAAVAVQNDKDRHMYASAHEAEGAVRLTLQTNEVTNTVSALLQVAGRLGHKLETLEVKAPTLEDTYLALTSDTNLSKKPN